LLPKVPLILLRGLALLALEFYFWDGIGVGSTAGIEGRLHRLKNFLLIT
jgi:hypothetical protein